MSEAPTKPAPAGFRVRLLAVIIDASVMLLPLALGLFAAFSPFITNQTTDLILVVTGCLFAVVLHLSNQLFFLKKHGATIGQKALGLQIIPIDDGTLEWKHVLSRAFLRNYSAEIFYTRYFFSSPSERTPLPRHVDDVVSGTIVVKKTKK